MKIKKGKVKRVPYSITKTFPFLILIATLFMCIGYAAVNSVLVSFNGEASAKEVDGVFITEISCYPNTSSCRDTNIISGSQTMLYTNIMLDNNINSSVTYQIKVFNNSDYLYYFDDILYLNEGDTYSNENIVFELKHSDNTTLFTKGVELAGKSYLTFNITFKYKDNANVSNGSLESYLNINFVPSYIVSFNYNDGTTGISNKRVIYNSTYGELPNPVRVGYIFNGWYTDKTAGDLINSDSIVQINSNTTLYAHWICNTFAPADTWFNRGSTPRSAITDITFVQDYVPPTYTDSWNIDVDNSGSLKAYVVNGTSLIINVSIEDKVYANPNSSYMFSGHSAYEENNRYFSSLTTINGLELLDTSQATTMRKLFYECEELSSVNLSNFNTSKVTSMEEMFSDCTKINNLNFSSFVTSSVTNMSRMFYDCSSLTTLNLQSFNTSKVTNMSYIFAYDKALTEIDISSFDFSQVTTLLDAFAFDSSLTTIHFPSKTNATKLTTTERMFYGVKMTSIDLSFLENTTSLTNTSNMFNECKKLTSVKFSNTFNTSKVTNMGSMFGLCTSLETLDLSMFDTKSVTSFSYVSTSTNPDYPIRGMFTACYKLKTIYVSDKFVTTNASNSDTGSTNMFLDCNSLVGGNGTLYNASFVDKTYARIDGHNSLPGYFTLK